MPSEALAKEGGRAKSSRAVAGLDGHFGQLADGEAARSSPGRSLPSLPRPWPYGAAIAKAQPPRGPTLVEEAKAAKAD